MDTSRPANTTTDPTRAAQAWRAASAPTYRTPERDADAWSSDHDTDR